MVDVVVVGRVDEGDDGLEFAVQKVEVERVESTDVAWAWLWSCGAVVVSSLSNSEEEMLRGCRLGGGEEAELRGVAI